MAKGIFSRLAPARRGHDDGTSQSSTSASNDG